MEMFGITFKMEFLWTESQHLQFSLPKKSTKDINSCKSLWVWNNKHNLMLWLFMGSVHCAKFKLWICPHQNHIISITSSHMTWPTFYEKIQIAAKLLPVRMKAKMCIKFLRKDYWSSSLIYHIAQWIWCNEY